MLDLDFLRHLVARYPEAAIVSPHRFESFRILNLLKPKPLVGFLLNPFGRHARYVEYDGHQIVVQAWHVATAKLRELSAAPTVESGFWGASLRLQLDDQPVHLLKGVRFKDAVNFLDAIRNDWAASNQADFEQRRVAVDALLLEIEQLSDPATYPAACVVSPILKRARVIPRS